jgi:serine/threonine protein kinase
MDTSAEQDSLVGTILAGKYEIEKRLGKGGMSVVYKALHKWMKKRVAVKMLLPERLHSSANVARFQQEARAAGALSHPNLMTVYDLGVTPEGVPYLAMEYVEGTGLSELIQAHALDEPQRCLDIFIQACQGLGAAHDHGIVHRDIKPSNVMVATTPEGKDLVKIVDFGIAKLLPTEGEEALKLTQTGESFGSPLYMSPEQCLARPQDARSDIYSMGCLMYEVLTGRPPLAGTSTLETMNLHINQLPPGLADTGLDSQLRQQLEAVLFKALAKEPERRYQNMRELIDALEVVRARPRAGILTSLKSLWEIRTLRRVPQGRRSLAVVGLSVAVVILVALSAWALNVLFSSPSRPYVETVWASVAAPPPEKTSDYMKKEKLVELMVALIEHRQGYDSPAIVPRVTNLGHFRKRYHQWGEAARCFKRALALQRQAGITEDLDAYQMRIDLADCYYELGQYGAAEPLYREAIDKVASMQDDPELEKPRAKLGDIYLRFGHWSEAKHYLSASIEELGLEKTPDLALTTSRLGDAYRLSGQLGLADNAYDRAIEVWKRLEGSDCRKNLALCLFYRGEVQRLQGQDQDAILTYEQALKAAQSAFGEQHPYVANILYPYSDLLWKHNRWLQALEMKVKANVIRSKKVEGA